MVNIQYDQPELQVNMEGMSKGDNLGTLEHWSMALLVVTSTLILYQVNSRVGSSATLNKSGTLEYSGVPRYLVRYTSHVTGDLCTSTVGTKNMASRIPRFLLYGIRR
jgi:hypothetical protein